MDCKTARLLLDFARPLASELEEGDSEALANHLIECPACAAAQRSERKFDEPISRAMRDVPVPPELHGRIMRQLSAQRDSWYRRRVWPSLAATAASIALIWFGIHQLTRSIEPNLARLQEDFNNIGAPTPAVAQWLQHHDGKEPPAFNTALLIHSTLADFQGKKVPLLEYRHGAEQAWIYILNDRDFNLQSLKDQVQSPSGRYAVTVLFNPDDDPHTAYVVVFTGQNLAPFMQIGRPAA